VERAVESTKGIYQRFGFDNHLRARGFSDLGRGLGLLMVKSSPEVNPNPRFGPIMNSSDVPLLGLLMVKSSPEVNPNPRFGPIMNSSDVPLRRAWARPPPQGVSISRLSGAGASMGLSPALWVVVRCGRSASCGRCGLCLRIGVSLVG